MSKRALDSFTIIVPRNKVDRYDSRFDSKVIEVYEGTGEIREEHERKPIYSDVNGITTRLSLRGSFRPNEYDFYIICTSKMIKQHYLKGITVHTIKYVYDYLMSLNLFEMTLDAFLECNIFDVDIKTDYEMTQPEFDEISRSKRRIVKGSKLYLNSDKRTVQGLQYGNRDRSTPTAPFVKYYSKGVELLENSITFKNEYLPTYSNNLLRRCEVTIKNSKMAQTLYKQGILPVIPKSLRDWLYLSQEQLRQVLIYCCHLHEREYDMSMIRKKREDNGLSASDYFLLRTLEKLLQDGHDINDLVSVMDDWSAKDTVKVTSKSRIKLKLQRFKTIIESTSDNLKNLGVYKYL